MKEQREPPDQYWSGGAVAEHRTNWRPPATERNVLGDDILTEGGASLGKVADLVLLVGSGSEVVGYQIDRAGGGWGYIPLPAQLSVPGVALVVPNIT